MYEQEIDRWFQGKEDRFVDLLRRLVAVPSLTADPQPDMPFGPAAAQALDLAVTLARQMGFPAANYENYVDVIDLNDRETRLGILCHLDVVAAGPGWDSDPFQVVIRDGVAYGRGVADDKGPAVASLLAMQAVRELTSVPRKGGIPLDYNTRLILGSDEETHSNDVKYYFAHEPTPPYVFTPDGKFPLTNTEKGHLQPYLSSQWETCDHLLRLISLHGGTRINVIPGQAEAVLAGFTPEGIQPYLKRAAERTGVLFTVRAEDGQVLFEAHGKGGHSAHPQGSLNALTGLLDLTAFLPLTECGSTEAVHTLHQLFPHRDYFGEALGIAQEDDLTGKLTLAFTMLDLNDTGFTGRFDSRTPLCATHENTFVPVQQLLAEKKIQMTGEFVLPHHTPADSPFVQTLLAIYEEFTGQPGFCESSGGGTYVHHIQGGVSFGAIMPVGYHARRVSCP